MAERDSRSERDLILAPNEFGWVMDEQTGQIKAFAGPIMSSLSQTEVCVLFDSVTKLFRRVDTDEGKQKKITVPEGWYVALKNPHPEGKQPTDSEKSPMPPLQIGRKVNIPGPVTFSLWPGQMSTTVKGHHLRQDEYLIVRVYDSEAAQKSFSETVVVQKRPDEGAEATPGETRPGIQPEAQEEESKKKKATPWDLDSLVTGAQFIVAGTEVSFFIPPTGIEIVKINGEYIQRAVSLERLEYCRLLDQDGNERYLRGPAVVFPRPTEEFVCDEKVTDSNGAPARKFRAIELGPKQGIYVKAIADYKDGDKEYEAGKELFITGEDTPIYFPRKEHSLIKYGEDYLTHHGVAIPPGEARYVLKRIEGAVDLVKGPTVFLPDPRYELIVRRVLPDKMCQLLYPGNIVALQVNQALAAASSKAEGTSEVQTMGAVTVAATANYLDEQDLVGSSVERHRLSAAPPRRRRASPNFSGDSFDREGQYVPPRSITLDSKYEGAVTISVYEGYAVMLVNKRGGRRIVRGPETALLEYDELPHVLKLSSGKPKTTDKLVETVYLQTTNIYVTDIFTAETKDYCEVQMKLSYRLNFVGDDPEKWFSVENYVKLLCDRMRSMVRNKVRSLKVDEFYNDSTNILRDLILGQADEESDERPGRMFRENNMHVSEVEVLTVKLRDDIQKMLQNQEQDTFRRAVQLSALEKELEFTLKSEEIKRSMADAQETTRQKKEDLVRTGIADTNETELKRIETRAAEAEREHALRLANQNAENQVAAAARDSREADLKLEQDASRFRQQLEVALMDADAKTTAEKMGAMSERLVAALQAIGDGDLAVRVAQALSTQGMLRTMKGEGIMDVLGNVLSGTEIGKRLTAVNAHGSNATTPPAE